MLSNAKLTLGFTLLLGGCGGGYGHAPRLADAPADLRDAPPTSEPAPIPAEPRQSGYVLQGDYPPEPGVPRHEADAPRAGGPGARYPMPDERRSTVGKAYRPVSDLAPPPEVAAGNGPRGTSGGTSGEAQRYDAVGYASWYGEEMNGNRMASGQPFDPNAITAAHRTLPLGSFVEVTALDTGRTVLVLITDRGPGNRTLEIDLSRGAAQQLGIDATAPVRVRLVLPPPTDQIALRSGQSAAPRIDAPQALLTALRRKLPVRGAGSPRPLKAPPVRAPLPIARPVPDALVPRPAAAPMRATAGIFVQVAALSNEGKAQELATRLQGRVQRAGAIYRVQIGPYATTASAKAARDDIARRGYGDARIVQTN